MPTFHQLQQKLQSEDDLLVFLTRKELKELPRVLWKDEELETIVYGHYNGCNGILVCTDARIIFADKGVHAFTVEPVELSKLVKQSQEMGDKFGSFTFQLPKKTVVFEYLDKKTYDKLSAWLKTKLASPQNIGTHLSRETSADAENAAPAGQDDVYAKIEKLAQLKDRGILTDAEFQQQKKKLLGAADEPDLSLDLDDDVF